MSEMIVKQLNQLIEEGFELADTISDLTNSPEGMDWYQNCKSFISSVYGRRSNEYEGFKTAKFPNGKLMILQTLIGKVPTQMTHSSDNPSPVININQTQITSVKNEISFNILLCIEYSDLSKDEKQKASELFDEVKEEVQKPVVNWNKVTELLKNSFDYGLKIAPDIVKFADAYYRAKGHS